MKCCQLGCYDKATHRVFWPNNSPLTVCSDHAKLADKAAGIIGVVISIEEIPHDSGGEGESNNQSSEK